MDIAHKFKTYVRSTYILRPRGTLALDMFVRFYRKNKADFIKYMSYRCLRAMRITKSDIAIGVDVI